MSLQQIGRSAPEHPRSRFGIARLYKPCPADRRLGSRISHAANHQTRSTKRVALSTDYALTWSQRPHFDTGHDYSDCINRFSPLRGINRILLTIDTQLATTKPNA